MFCIPQLSCSLILCKETKHWSAAFQLIKKGAIPLPRGLVSEWQEVAWHWSSVWV